MEFRDDEVVVGCDAFRIYRSGKMDRLHRPERVPAGLDPATGVTSKDVVLDAGTGLSARLFLPRLGARGSSSGKLPVLVFLHGGAFLIESAVSPQYHGGAGRVARRPRGRRPPLPRRRQRRRQHGEQRPGPAGLRSPPGCA